MRQFIFIVLLFCCGQVFIPCWAFDNSEENRKDRISLLNQLKPTEMIIYKPSGERKATLTVFTSLGCGYCTRLHAEIAELLELGIEVHYLAYPMQGVGSESYNRMEAIWCARDRKEAMSRSMQGEHPGIMTCENPMTKHISIGRKMGIRGTPTILFEDGTLFGGYLSAQRLAQRAINHSLSE